MIIMMMMIIITIIKVYACAGPEGFRNLRLPDIQTIGRWWYVVSPTHRPPLGIIAGTHFCRRLSRPHDHSAAGRINSMKNSNNYVPLIITIIIIIIIHKENTTITTHINTNFISLYITKCPAEGKIRSYNLQNTCEHLLHYALMLRKNAQVLTRPYV